MIEISNETLDELIDNENQITYLKKHLKEIEERQEELKLSVFNKLSEACENTYENDRVNISIKKGITRRVIDTAKLKSAYPEIANEVLKDSVGKDSLSIKVKKGE